MTSKTRGKKMKARQQARKPMVDRKGIDSMAEAARYSLGLVNKMLVANHSLLEKHVAVTKTVKGVEKDMCPVCKVVAPCTTWMELNSLVLAVEHDIESFVPTVRTTPPPSITTIDAITPQAVLNNEVEFTATADLVDA